ncbi:MAG: molybdenum cofactor guanylyltransferase [Pseudomonadota bacterium]
MNQNCTGVILAGGRNIRLPGIKKTFHEIQGRRVMDCIYGMFTSLFDRVIVVANDPGDFVEWDALIVSDIDPSRCSMAGLHAGLFYADTPWCFVSACDTPFLKEDLARHILSCIRPGIDVVIPETEGGLEPLFAAYSRECLPLIEKNLEAGIYMIKRFFRKNRVDTIPLDVVRRIDPGMTSFFNINTPEDLETARQMASREQQ